MEDRVNGRNIPVTKHASPLAPDAVARFVGDNVSMWIDTPDVWPAIPVRYTLREQVQREEELDTLLERLPASSDGFELSSEKERLEYWSPVRLLLTQLLRSNGSRITRNFFDACKASGEMFYRQARTFDRSLTEHDVRQALRNLWVFNCLQFIRGRSVSLSPSSFAYSLLYPYTDNWLDGAIRTPEAKQSFSRWLALRLKGESLPSDVHTCRMIERLLSMIEEEYPRSACPGVWQSLQAIHAAQEKSLLLHNPPAGKGEDALLQLTVEKGGTSVLADGMLVEGSLDEPVQESMFAFGVALQLVDDLQDLGEDRAGNASTPFVRAATVGTLDAATKRLFQFVRRVTSNMKIHVVEGREEILSVIVQSCDLLIMDASVRNREWCSPEFLAGIEHHLPVRSSYLVSLRERLEKRLTAFRAEAAK